MGEDEALGTDDANRDHRQEQQVFFTGLPPDCAVF